MDFIGRFYRAVCQLRQCNPVRSWFVGHSEVITSGFSVDAKSPMYSSSLSLGIGSLQDESTGSALVSYSSVSALVGRVKQKLAPQGELAAAHKRPPCDSMIERLMGSPIPVPLSLVVKNALKILSACSGGNPTPVSLTEISS